MSRLPAEARDGLLRAWLEILRQRNPEVTWVAAVRPEQNGVCQLDLPDTPIGGSQFAA